MTTMRERLAQLAQADFDTFGEPAESAGVEPDLTPDEWVAIRDEIQHAPWNDPARYPELVVEALKVLGDVALSGDPFSRRTATQCLRRMVYRARNGGWPGEQEAEPAWSLDGERGGPR